MPAERLLVNFFYAPPVGHAIEALQYCLGHHAADPSREVALALNAASAVELGALCPFLSACYAVEHPLLEPCRDSPRRIAGIPRRWDWVLDDPRRYDGIQLGAFPGLGHYYAATDRCLVATGRGIVGADPPGYRRRQQLRLRLPAAVRTAAAAELGGPAIAIMPAGSGERHLYPSLASWQLILDALHEAFPAARLALVGKLRRNAGTATALRPAELTGLLDHRSRPLDCFDRPLVEQLATVEACDLFLAPHTGFGMAALAVGTPWLSLAGGRWFEYYFNAVPFRSVIPDVERYPCFSQLATAAVSRDEDGPRTPSMTRSRIHQDLDRLVVAAGELLEGSVTYEQALCDYFRDLVAAHHGDTSLIWSIDDVHRDYVSARS